MVVREIEPMTWERVGLFLFPADIHQARVEYHAKYRLKVPVIKDDHTPIDALAWERSNFKKTTTSLH
jgi:hypothetical protein